jgi:hypothetical protein
MDKAITLQVYLRTKKERADFRAAAKSQSKKASTVLSDYIYYYTRKHGAK